MNYEKNLKELINKIFETGELYDELFDLIERLESESLKPDDNNIYSIYYDPQDGTFAVCESADYGSYPTCGRLIHIISISNQYNDEFWGGFEEDENYTISDYISDTIADSCCIDFYMEQIETELKSRLSLYQY